MTFETPVQQVPAKPWRGGLVLTALITTAGLLVWQPWSSGSAAVPGETPVSAVTAAPGAVLRTPSPTPLAIAYAPPHSLPILREASFLLVPAIDRFRPRWSIVGVTEVPDREVRVIQLPIILTSGLIEARSAAEVCRIGRLRSAMVAVLPADRLSLIGIAAPAGAIDGPTELTQIDAPLLTAYEVPVPSLTGPEAALAAARLFVPADLLPWPVGAYRFLTQTSDGTPQFLYACLVPPSMVDGT